MTCTTERPPGQPAGARSEAGTASRVSPFWNDRVLLIAPRRAPFPPRAVASTSTADEPEEARTSERPDVAEAANDPKRTAPSPRAAQRTARAKREYWYSQ